MKRSAPTPSDANSDEQEVYTPKGYSAYMGNRTAQKSAQFFLPQLSSNMSLLDCGCGPGSITCGLAAVVAPGDVVGIDANPEDIEKAQALAAQQGLANLRFETADVYDLPFDGGTFDVVFSHALMEHLRDPLRALKEMRRVLKSGGVIGVRAPDHNGNLHAPPDPKVTRLGDLFRRLMVYNGRNPYIGKRLPGLLREAGFARIEGSASYTLVTKSAVPPVKGLPMMEQLIELGWADREEVDSMSDAYQEWLDHPDMLNARAWCEAIAWKE